MPRQRSPGGAQTGYRRIVAKFGTNLLTAGGDELDARVNQLCERLAGNAPITMRVTKESLRRLLHAGLPDGEDLIRQCYGSQDFHIGVESFMEKREPRWTGK